MSSKKNFKVLVVDDDADILELLQYNLSKEGYEVKVADNGKKAIEIAKDFVPSLILLDVMMPGMDGYAVCATLKADPDTRNIPVIFVTAKNDAESESRALAEGAVDFIHKQQRPLVSDTPKFLCGIDQLSDIRDASRHCRKVRESRFCCPCNHGCQR